MNTSLANGFVCVRACVRAENMAATSREGAENAFLNAGKGEFHRCCLAGFDCCLLSLLRGGIMRD